MLQDDFIFLSYVVTMIAIRSISNNCKNNIYLTMTPAEVLIRWIRGSKPYLRLIKLSDAEPVVKLVFRSDSFNLLLVLLSYVFLY